MKFSFGLVLLLAFSPAALAGKSCVISSCKKGFDTALSKLSKDKISWEKDASDALKRSGQSACRQEVAEIEQAGSLAVTGCDDCNYGLMSSSIQKETPKEEDEDALKFSPSESLANVFSKIRSDAINDLKEECAPKSKTANKTNPHPVLKSNTSFAY